MSTWVFLRGLMREQRHWGGFVAEFQRALPDARIVLLDMPGNGVRWREPSATRVEAMVEACRAELHARGESGPFHLLALSLGAMVASAWCARHPREVAAAVLINTSMRPHGRFHERLRWRNYGALAALAMWPGRARQEATLLRLTSNRHGADASLHAAWTGYQAQYPVRRLNALRQLLAAARFRAPAAAPALPLLVMASQADRLVDVRCSQRLAQAWQLPLRLHPDAGHDLPLDDGTWVAQAVRAWLAGWPS